MIAREWGKISEADIRDLLGVAHESKTLEFKRQLPSSDGSGVSKFLRSVTALANTSGGDIIYGIVAESGVATSISGLPEHTLDRERLRLSQLLRSHVDPPLPSFELEPIACGSEGHVLLVRVAKSWQAPHRITTDNTFYARNSAGNYPLDVRELRAAFNASDGAAERIRRFRADRLIKINVGDTPLPMIGAAMVIHVIPLPTFADGSTIDIVGKVAQGRVPPLPPGERYQRNRHINNLDGVLTYRRDDDESPEVNAYAQAFRNGAVEGLTVLRDQQDTGVPYLTGTVFEKEVISSLSNYLSFLHDVEVSPPYFLFLSLCGVKGCIFKYPTEYGTGVYKAGPLKDDMIILPEVMADTHQADLTALMRIPFHTVWNAFGLAGSEMYDGEGNWKK